MGMFDLIEGNVKCPLCGETTFVHDQFKWLLQSGMDTYTIGDEINLVDGDYESATSVRPQLIGKCEHCGEEFAFGVTVEGGIIQEIYATGEEIIDIDN